MKYFIQTIRFSPKIPEGFGLKKENDNIYISKEDLSIWRYRKLLDLGWGKEHGFFRVPILTFEHLLNYVFDYEIKRNMKITDDLYNFYGSLSVLIDDHANRFIYEIEQRFMKGTFNINNNKFIVDYLNKEFNIDENMLVKISDKNSVKTCLLWKKVYHKIK